MSAIRALRRHQLGVRVIPTLAGADERELLAQPSGPAAPPPGPLDQSAPARTGQR